MAFLEYFHRYSRAATFRMSSTPAVNPKFRMNGEFQNFLRNYTGMEILSVLIQQLIYWILIISISRYCTECNVIKRTILNLDLITSLDKLIICFYFCVDLLDSRYSFYIYNSLVETLVVLLPSVIIQWFS